MKKIVLLPFFATLALAVAFFVERVVIQHMFGPSSILAMLALAIVGSFLLVTYVLFETRFRETIARIWLVLISVSVSYLAVDLMAGFILITPLSPALSPDEIRHHRLEPNTYSKIEQRDFSYVQRVNNLGLRGDDTTIEKPAGTYRILMLGDSFTMGKGVEDDETFSALLQIGLSASDSVCTGERVEVLNAGVDSYAPILSFLQLKRDLVRVQPDMIIFSLDVSDLVQEEVYRTQAVYDVDGDVVAVPGGEERTLLNERIRRWIENHLYLTRLALFYFNKAMGYRDFTIRGVVEQANTEIVQHTLESDTVDRTEQWRQIFKSIAGMKEFSEENDIEYILTVYPWGHQVNDTEWIPGRYAFMPQGSEVSDASLRTIKELAQEYGIELFDMFPAFRSYDGDEALYFEYDMHWTKEGHKVMAAELQRQLANLSIEHGCP